MRNYDRVQARPATDSDQPLLRKLFATSRPDLALLPSALVDMQFEAREREYSAAYPNASREILIVDETPMGSLLVDRDSWRLVDICLLPEFRGRGIGSQVLSSLLEEAAQAKACISLQVANDNPARRLYERLGFVEVGRDAMYTDMKAVNLD